MSFHERSGLGRELMLGDWLRRQSTQARAVVGAEGSFRRNALVLTGGTLVAQAFPLLLYPVFTRLYPPAAFGVFATLSLFYTISSLLASGTYDQAILIAPSKRVAAHLVSYALLRASVVLVALLALVLPFGSVITRFGVDAAVVAWLPTVPVVAMSLVIYTAYSEWCVRNGYFGELSRARIWQTSAIAVGRIGFGLASPALNGFVLGDAVGKFVSAARCVSAVLSRDRKYLHIHTLGRVTTAAQRYSHIARYSLPDQLVNNLAGSIHVLFLGAAFGTAELGYVTLVLSLLYLPVTIVSSAVKDVFRQRASLEFQSTGSCRATYKRLLVPIGLMAVAGFGALHLSAPWLFTFVLGPEWAVAGDYARILTPLFFWNFVSMSLGGVLVIAERTDVSLVWQVSNLMLTVAALWFGTQVLGDIEGSLWIFSVARALSYVLYMGLSYRYAERRPLTARG